MLQAPSAELPLSIGAQSAEGCHKAGLYAVVQATVDGSVPKAPITSPLERRPVRHGGIHGITTHFYRALVVFEVRGVLEPSVPERIRAKGKVHFPMPEPRSRSVPLPMAPAFEAYVMAVLVLLSGIPPAMLRYVVTAIVK